MIDTDFFSKFNAPNKSFKSMVSLTEFGDLKRMSEYDLNTLVPSYEAFSQLIRCKPALTGPENVKLKKINWQVSKD